jgi:hypothetical protein
VPLALPGATDAAPQATVEAAAPLAAASATNSHRGARLRPAGSAAADNEDGGDRRADEASGRHQTSPRLADGEMPRSHVKRCRSHDGSFFNHQMLSINSACIRKTAKDPRSKRNFSDKKIIYHFEKGLIVWHWR